MEFKQLCEENPFLVLDGAIGTELQRLCRESGVTFPFPEMLNFTHPEIVQSVIRSYAESGANLLLANSFGLNRLKLSSHGIAVDDAIKTALSVAREAARGYAAYVGLDASTLGELMEPSGTLRFEQGYDLYAEMFIAAERHGADFILIETMTDLYETKAALLAAKENTSLPVFCSMTFEANRRTFTGCSVSAMALTLTGLGADAIGVNCSLGPLELAPVVEELLSATPLPILVKPNAGLPDPKTGAFAMTPEEFAEQMTSFARKGVKILGGCCGTNPLFIKALSAALYGIKPDRVMPERIPAVCTPSATITLDMPRIIGERINPTGKKRFKQALLDNDIGYILGQAIEQVDAGAEILDVNVGLPGIDEREMMVKVIKKLQAVTDAPLQIDSTNPEVIAAALRVYNGKAIVNSVNGEPETWEAVFPAVKKYGAAVLGLTLDKNGIPKKAEARFAIAENILRAALSYGIAREDVYIDCLTLTASAEQEAVPETLKAVALVTQKLGLKTVLGVSNISFGLPCREYVNSTFLTMALQNGLTLPILNPNIPEMTAAVYAFRLLSGFDENSLAFIDKYGSSGAEKSKTPAQKQDMTLAYAIQKGLKDDARALTESLLQSVEPLDIISGQLIPALDDVGQLFEHGKLFLPQLILSADTAGVCFEQIRRALAASGGQQVAKGKIVLATVRGDIHDIGKNIVKVLLENYGYTVIDLGRDVPEEEVCKAAKDSGAKLVGLSALMTTTLPAMESTIKALRNTVPDCKIMVGGAVLTPEYAMEIGADYYSPDAKHGVDIAKEIYG